jgi:hypothetical protein
MGQRHLRRTAARDAVSLQFDWRSSAGCAKGSSCPTRSRRDADCGFGERGCSFVADLKEAAQREANRGMAWLTRAEDAGLGTSGCTSEATFTATRP